MKILLAAEEAAGVQLLRQLLSGPDEIVGVLTAGENAAFGATVESIAKKEKIPLFPARLVTDPAFASQIGDFDLLLNVHSLFRIHPALVEAPRIGAFNLHPGPLPRFAGLNAPSWAIYLGETNHAVTLHWVTADIDEGPVAYESRFAIDEQDTGLSISLRCVREGLPLVVRLLEIARESPEQIPLRPQPHELRRVFRRGAVPLGGRIDWSLDAVQIGRLIRACDYHPLRSPWGQAWTSLDHMRIELVRARIEPSFDGAAPASVLRSDKSGVWIAGGSGVVVLDRILINGRLTSAADVLHVGQKLN